MSRFANLKKLNLPEEPEETRVTPEPEVRKRGRPPGKRSNPDFVLTSLYVESSVLREAKKRLLDEGVDLSGVVNALLKMYLSGELDGRISEHVHIQKGK